MMTIHDRIMAIYPDLTTQDFLPGTGTIRLQNDSDGRGDYIAVWNHPTHPRPTQEQLDAVEAN
ncbi:Bacteriophage SP-beta, YorD [uncultured Caudovirales phage]|uniref:Bacteriophage SP-beta, YorD n=1 Tax=uncultured Caudovirales phage TaxID=2100421 RepID=A0A6J5P076_9CAUD|nr:Bacteriophage SP-beta, YorD [uncultured Caudovirales phage]